MSTVSLALTFYCVAEHTRHFGMNCRIPGTSQGISTGMRAAHYSARALAAGARLQTYHPVTITSRAISDRPGTEAQTKIIPC